MIAEGSIRRQILSCICANLMTVAVGASITWPAANFMALRNPETSLPSGPLSVQEAVLVITIYYVGGVIGNLMVPSILRKYGCKRVMLSIAIPQIIIWLLILFAQNPYYLYATGIIRGVVNAGQVNSMPMFVSEISHDKIRGSLNAFYDPAYNLGALFTFFLANSFNYADQAKFLMILPIVFMILFCRMPDTPQHLIKIGKQLAANRANTFYKGTRLEFFSMNAAKDIREDSILTLSDFTNRRSRKAIFIAFSMMFLYPLQGPTILWSYITEILSSSHPSISPLYVSSIITTIVIVTNLVYLNVVDRAGRRTFYIYSSLAAAVGLTLFAIYLYCLTDNWASDWVPVVCISYVLIVNCLGMYPMPWLIIIETMPQKIKQYGYSSSVLLYLINSFIFTQIYPLLKEVIGLLGWIIIFAAASFCSVLFGLFVLPETRGKSYEEIMLILDE